MSCHDIGRGMDSVTQVVIKMYDAGEITIKTALKLFTALKKGVYWCDGNENEAVQSIFNCRCGNCLKKMKTGEKLFNIYDSPSGIEKKFLRYFEKLQRKLCRLAFLYRMF